MAPLHNIVALMAMIFVVDGTTERVSFGLENTKIGIPSEICVPILEFACPNWAESFVYLFNCLFRRLCLFVTNLW
jgi:hypothetical protein